MPTYQFQTESGATVDIDMAASDAPEAGSVIERDGVRLTRIYSSIQTMASMFKPFKSMSLGHGWPYANKWEKLANGKKGAPIFTNEAEVKGAMAAGAANGEGTSWKSS